MTQKISICPLQKGYFLLPLSSLLDSVFKSKMKSKAELKIMFFFFMLHSLFVILSFSPCFFFFNQKKICNKKNNFLSHVAAMRSFSSFLVAHSQLWHSFITRIFQDRFNFVAKSFSFFILYRRRLIQKALKGLFYSQQNLLLLKFFLLLTYITYHIQTGAIM